ncbi:LuxR C-terminal-related transcriptional regulator [Streptomyces sp. BH105]|uniref:helix-turn-helix transcriptional regulator n=1 Tax=Streptomyces sp. BH105 TaxID=3410408 RepID=UPI003CEBC662
MDQSDTSSPTQGWSLSQNALALVRRIMHGHTIEGTEPGLTELKELGIATLDPWNGRYVVTDLPDLQRRVHAEQRRRISDALHDQMQADNFFRSMAKLSNERVPGIRYLGSKEEAQAALVGALEQVRSEIRTAQPLRRPPELLKTALQTDIPRLERGIRLRTIYPDSARSRPGEREYTKQVTDLGASVRTLASDFVRTVIVDDTLAVISDYRMAPPDPNIAWAITHPGMLAFVTEVYERQWDTAVPWTADGSRPDGDITTPRSREILRRLLRGQTIKQIATGMDLSVGTINSQISHLYERTGTSSHFALGAWWASSPERKLS